MLGCLYLQVRLFSWESDGYDLTYIWDWDTPSRMTVPFYVGAVLIVGSIVGGAFAWAVPGSSDAIANFHDYLGLVLRCAVCALLLILKGYFGPAVSGGIISYALFGWVEHGEFRVLPLLDELLEWVFSGAAAPLHFVYLFFVTAYGLMSPFVRWESLLKTISD